MKEFDLSATYLNITQRLAKEERGLVRFSPPEIKQILHMLGSLSPESPSVQHYQMFCVLAHFTNPEAKVEAWITACLAQHERYEGKSLIALLNTALKHNILGAQVRGEKVSKDFLDHLRPLLHHPEAEVVEWTLRIIESLGAQGLIFARELDQIKPAPWKLLFLTQRNIRELIALLERRWKSYGKR
jgi:hypothetical protein